MADSIMQTSRECFVTHSTEGLHKHHIFRGSRRKAADKWGCWVWLRWDWHNGASYSAHNNPTFERQLKQLCQQEFEKRYGHEKFMTVFGKNYLEDYD